MTISRIVYCTARVDAATSPEAYRDQDVYLQALVKGRVVDHIEHGRYVERAKTGLLATRDPITKRPIIHEATWPVMVQDECGRPVPKARHMVQYLHLEEKGSDVNVATHLLLDVLDDAIDAAIVVSNDSDLALPLAKARQHVPVGTVNPSSNQIAGALRGQPTDGAGGHWWWRIRAETYRACQLPDPYAGQSRPVGW